MPAFSLLLALTFAVAGALAAETRRPDPNSVYDSGYFLGL
jgi:hypothetical protein